MSQWHKSPMIYEINTAVWLNELSRRYDRPVTLGTVTDDDLDYLAGLNVDAIWLMGIWQRGPAGLESALNYMHEYEGALPDITEDDVMGSAYSIADYQVDHRLGGRDELAHLRGRLRDRGLKLILDYVPNHVAIDHAWVTEKPHYLVRGTKKWLKEAPDLFFKTTSESGQEFITAHGRDPYFPGWIDTAQVNAFSTEYRQHVVELLKDIASQCDGVRCDMAMLMMNDIFSNTWSQYLNETAPATEFWEDIIPAVRETYPDFLFMAEVYWDMEYQLLQQGFDFTYDKRLYDRILDGHIPSLRDHLHAALSFQQHQVRFIENHDEPRAMSTLGVNKQRPAATMICTLPGAKLLHDGQFVGRNIKLPVQIKRQPDEIRHRALEDHYYRLLQETTRPIYQHGDWRMFEIIPAYPDNYTNEGLISYGWTHEGEFRLVVINLTPVWSNAIIQIYGWPEISENYWRIFDVLNDVCIYRDGKDLAENGLRLDVAVYQSHIFRFERLEQTFEAEYALRARNK